MGTGEAAIAKLGDLTFQGKVGKNVATYAKAGQKLAHDLAAQIDDDGRRLEREIRKLKGHPALLGLDVYLQARRMRRKFNKPKELALEISRELVKFNGQYRKEFLDTTGHRRDEKRWQGEVDI